MSFEVEPLPSAWAYIALSADPTWNSEPRDAFTVANQRFLAKHSKISQVSKSKSLLHSQQEKGENGSIGVRSVKDVIPESRLAQFYGDFFYDDARENCYLTVTSKKSNDRCSVTRYENSDQTECWMLPEVEYWFRKLTYDTSDRHASRRRRHFKTLAEEEFERWFSSGERAREETALEARIRGVRALWQNFPPSNFPGGNAPGSYARDQSPPVSRKMRTRRRQPRRHLPSQQNTALSNQLLCSSPTKLDISRQPPPNFRRALGRFANSHPNLTRGAATRRSIFRAQVSKCTGLATSQKPTRTAERKLGIWWPRDNTSTDDNTINEIVIKKDATKDVDNPEDVNDAIMENEIEENIKKKKIENTKQEEPVAEEINDQMVSVVATNVENERKKRLYSTVLSMTPPSPVNTNLAGATRPQKFTPGLIKLNPKTVFLTRPRPTSTSKFEELEKQALEQYKPSDESIDTKFRELEKQAEEQYSPSNSNTSCGTEHSHPSLESQSGKQTKKHSRNSSGEKCVDSVIIYSQNFPDLNSKGRTKSISNLKNFHTPLGGEKRERTHRTNRTAINAKIKTQRAASDTEYYEGPYYTQEVRQNSIKCKLQAKKRHLSVSVSDPSSDEEDAHAPIKDARLSKKKNHIKSMMFKHGAGDLQKSK